MKWLVVREENRKRCGLMEEEKRKRRGREEEEKRKTGRRELVILAWNRTCFLRGCALFMGAASFAAIGSLAASSEGMMVKWLTVK